METSAERIVARLRSWLVAEPAEALGVLVLLAGVVVATVVWWHRPVPGPAPAPPGGSPGSAALVGEPPDGATPSDVTLVVHVVGAVARPGVVLLATDARVADAIAAAGGALVDADLARLNLARGLVDGEQVVVAHLGATGVPAPSTATPSTAAPIDLNTATPAELEALDGIGPVLARRIVEHRTAVGAFTDVAQLRDVAGIGEATFLRLAPEVVVR